MMKLNCKGKIGFGPNIHNKLYLVTNSLLAAIYLYMIHTPRLISMPPIKKMAQPKDLYTKQNSNLLLWVFKKPEMIFEVIFF